MHFGAEFRGFAASCRLIPPWLRSILRALEGRVHQLCNLRVRLIFHKSSSSGEHQSRMFSSGNCLIGNEGVGFLEGTVSPSFCLYAAVQPLAVRHFPCLTGIELFRSSNEDGTIRCFLPLPSSVTSMLSMSISRTRSVTAYFLGSNPRPTRNTWPSGWRRCISRTFHGISVSGNVISSPAATQCLCISSTSSTQTDIQTP